MKPDHLKKGPFRSFDLKLFAFSLVLAFVLWLIIMNVSDRAITKTISNIPVETVNGESIENTGYVYTVSDGDTVSIIVKGSQSIVDSLSADDFTATADLSQLSITNTAEIVASPVDPSIANLISITYINRYVTLSVEKKVSKDVSISVYAENSVADGYAAGPVTATPNIITVTGPESIIEKISTVRAIVDMSGRSSDFETQAELSYLDASGEKLNSTQLTASSDKVTVSAEIYPIVTVDVNVSITGSPADGYGTGDVTFKPDTVEVAGPEDVIKGLSEISISDISVSGLSENLETNVNVSKYLPDGVVLVDPDAQIAVNVAIEPITTVDISVKSSDVTLKNKSDEFDYNIIIPDTFKLTVTGIADDIDNLTAKDLNISIDMKTYAYQGRYELDPEVESIDNVKITKTGKISIAVSRKATDEADDTEE